MIDITANGPVWTITLNRPDKANALTKEMLATLANAVTEAEQAGAKVLILTGQGRVFSAGADLDAARSTDLATDPVWERLSQAVKDFGGLSIAALNGTVAGGAIGMVLACDLRIAVPGAKLFYPVVRNGFLPQPSDPDRMRTLVGEGRTKMVLLAGQKIDTETALSWGLFDGVEPVETLMDRVETMYADVLTAPRNLVTQIKRSCERQETDPT